MRVIFVCTGNTCRSPMAEGYLRERIRQDAIANMEAASCGLMANAGHPATPHAVEAMRKCGIDISGHRARAFNTADLREDDILLVMGDSHLGIVRMEAPAAFSETLGAFSGLGGNVPDPFGMSQEIYDETANVLCKMVDAALLRILKEKDA